MSTTAIALVVVAVVLVLAVGIGAYIWASRRKAQLDSILDDGREKLIRKYSEDRATKILEALENYVNLVSLQLAVDLYLQYDNQEGVTKIVNDIGVWPKTREVVAEDKNGARVRKEEGIVHHVRTLASGIGAFGHFEAAYYTTAPRWSADKKAQLANKYQDVDTYKRILGFEVWTGQTEDQVRDALGEPWAVDEKVLKTKTKYVWKYEPLGTNSYVKRVTIENGVVVAYDIKG